MFRRWHGVMSRASSESKAGTTAFNLSRLAPPEPKYDPQIHLAEERCVRTGKLRKPFETLESVQRELRFRIHSLKIANGPGDVALAKQAKLVEELTLALALSQKGESSRTLVDPAFMRQLRRRLVGQLWKAVASHAGERVWIYTLVRADQAIPASSLRRFKPKLLLESTRLDLTRAGLATLSGWAILFVHGDYDSLTDMFQPHVHALVVGPKALAFEALRDLPAYKGGRAAAVRTPIKRQRLKNPVRQLSYLLQQFWPHKRSEIHPTSKRKRRVRTKRRIPEPRHSQWLLWLAAQRLSDLVWFHGISIRKGGLSPK